MALLEGVVPAIGKDVPVDGASIEAVDVILLALGA